MPLCKELVNRTPWETALRGKGAGQSWQSFTDAFHRAQELLIPRCKKLGKEGMRLAGMSQDLLVKLKGKEKMYRLWKQGHKYPRRSIGMLFIVQRWAQEG